MSVASPQKEILEKFQKEQEDFINEVLEAAQKRNLCVAIGAKGIFTPGSVGISGEMTTVLGLIESMKIEARVLVINKINKRGTNDKNDQSVGAGDSQLRGNEGVVEQAQNPS